MHAERRNNSMAGLIVASPMTSRTGKVEQVSGKNNNKKNPTKLIPIRTTEKTEASQSYVYRLERLEAVSQGG